MIPTDDQDRILDDLGDRYDRVAVFAVSPQTQLPGYGDYRAICYEDGAIVQTVDITPSGDTQRAETPL